MPDYLLTLNGGSSSLKFALFEENAQRNRVLSGQFERIGLPDTKWSLHSTLTNQEIAQPVNAADHAACIAQLNQWLESQGLANQIHAIGHRIVHGGPKLIEPQIVTSETIVELERIRDYAPEHLPAEIAILRAVTTEFPTVKQVACFDTAFHQTMPRVAQLLPLPRRYFEQGVKRYGFHGLSYQYLIGELERLAGRDAAHARVILAHLGNGASMAAVRDAKSIDTTMSFTPTAGLVMSTRTGDLDPGIVSYLAHSENLTPDRFHHLVNAESGLQGVSETSSDMRDLLARAATDERAADAIALFCNAARKFIGAYAAVLGGLDTLVFSGGIGEHAPAIRAQICKGLQFLGIEIESERNASNEPIISTDTSLVTVRVIPTDEEIQIAKLVVQTLS